MARGNRAVIVLSGSVRICDHRVLEVAEQLLAHVEHVGGLSPVAQGGSKLMLQAPVIQHRLADDVEHAIHLGGGDPDRRRMSPGRLRGRLFPPSERSSCDGDLAASTSR